MAPGEQNMRASFPKDKLEYMFFQFLISYRVCINNVPVGVCCLLLRYTWHQVTLQ